MPSLLGRPSLARAAVVSAGTAVGLVALLSAKASTSPTPAPVALGSRVPPGGQASAAPAPSTPATGPSTGPSAAPSTGPSSRATSHARPSTSSTASAGAARRTVTGPVVQTDYGPVQVKVVAKGHRILDVVAVQTPNGDRHSEEVAAYAVPILHQEALAAQSAQIDAVSGATFTSMGYVQSLQAALDALSQ